jgi:molecular chaperone DnaK (HSP70)
MTAAVVAYAKKHRPAIIAECAAADATATAAAAAAASAAAAAAASPSEEGEGAVPAVPAALPPSERFVAIVDMGGSSTTVGIGAVTGTGCRLVTSVSNASLGADVFHKRLFDVVAAQCNKKHGVTLLPTSRAGGRATRECEKAKKVCVCALVDDCV